MKDIRKIYPDDFGPDTMKLGQATAHAIAQLLLRIENFRIDFFLEDLAVKLMAIEKGKVTAEEVLYELQFRLKYDVHAHDYHEMRKKALLERDDAKVCFSDLEKYLLENPLCDSADWRSLMIPPVRKSTP